MNTRTEDSLAPAGYRFPLAATGEARPVDAGVAVPPFGVRFFRPVGPTCEVASPPAYRYSHADQLALTPDGTPVIDVAHLGAEPTTTGQGDGRRGEEFRIDYVADGPDEPAAS